MKKPAQRRRNSMGQFLPPGKAAPKRRSTAQPRQQERVAPRLTADAVDRLSRRRLSQAEQLGIIQATFSAARPPPGVVPEGRATLAMDNNIRSAANWAAQRIAEDQKIVFSGGFAGGFGGEYGPFGQGLAFLSYPYLSELALRAEYRLIVETIATEMTRKGIEIQASGNAGTGQNERVKQLEAELERLQVMTRLSQMVEGDGYFGRGHLYLDYAGASDDRNELKMPIGDGRNEITRSKVKPGTLERLIPVEAIWSYPTNYNSSDPLKPDWYRPNMWFAMGKEVHASRYLTFIGHPVPDLFKPAFSFGGLSMTQMAKPTVDNWLRTRTSISDLLHSFTVWNLATDLSASLEPGGNVQFDLRAQLFNNLRDNKGLHVTNKETEELKNLSVPLGTLDALQAQSQEHICSVSRIPTIKYTGIDPAGLNASSEGSIRTFYDTINAMQPRFFGSNMDRIFYLAQVNLWGAVDPSLSYRWKPLWSMDEKEEAEVRKIDAETDDILTSIGAVDNTEVRTRVATDPNTPYKALNLSKVIEPPDYGSQNSEMENLHNSGEGSSGAGGFNGAAH